MSKYLLIKSLPRGGHEIRRDRRIRDFVLGLFFIIETMHLSTRLFHEKEKEKQGDLVIGEYQGWMNVWRADIKFDIYPRSSDERFPSRSGDSCHAQLSCFKDFSSTVCIDARCAFNEPYRYAWSSEMTLVSALECSHVARAFLVSNVPLAETFLRDEKERPRALNFNPFKLSFVICRN